MASKASRGAINMMRAVLGEVPSEAELIRCLYMARSDVALAINHYMDSSTTSTSFARGPPPRRTSDSPPTNQARSPPPLKPASPPAEAALQSTSPSAYHATESTPEPSLNGYLGEDHVQTDGYEQGYPETLTQGADNGRGAGQLNNNKHVELRQESPVGMENQAGVFEPEAQVSPTAARADVSIPVIDITQHRPRLPNKPALKHRDRSRSPIEISPDSELPAPFRGAVKNPSQRRGSSGEWWLLKDTQVTAYSTTKGRKLALGEEVTFIFPREEKGNAEKKKPSFRGGKPAGQNLEIVRFSTQRAGELGRLPGDIAKCLIPLVHEKKMKIEGTCVSAPEALTIMCNMHLSLRIYVSRALFTKPAAGSGANANTALNENTTGHPFSSLLEQLNMRPFQRAQFTPEDFFNRKRALALEGDGNENGSKRACVAGQAAVPVLNGEATKEEGEEVLDDKEVDRLVGSSDGDGLEEMEPPLELLSKLRPYQKQALGWMSKLELGDGLEGAEKTLHPCWEAYRLADRQTPFYHNVFGGDVTLEFPSALTTARGGILADAMGLGKTVMTISLIVTNRGRGGDTLTDFTRPDGDALAQNGGAGEAGGASPLRDENLADGFGGANGLDTARLQSNQQASTTGGVDLGGAKPPPWGSKRKRNRRGGGTLLVCPMTLLAQWKAEVEAHSKPGTLSVYCYYGSDRAREKRALTKHDVVITTYGTLSSECGHENFLEEGPVHSVHWFRVVLDEAHSIKGSKTQAAKAVFCLTADRRWCLTGTPIQNKLEDIYSLLHFLRVEPWSNWGWWHKLIQRPYEEGDERSLKLLQAILKPLMLRRTKDTTDKDGNPILVLPPADMAVVECEFNEEERDFYDALYTKSKRKFDSFVEAGRVLHNYASILELLLRLRQCCDHPFLVLSRGDTSDYADLDKLANRFLKGPPKPKNRPRSPSPINTDGAEEPFEPDAAPVNRPSKAYIANMLEDFKAKDGKVECPICLDGAEDGILTPCAHAMCRECLLASWRTPAGGLCPVCRQPVQRHELTTLPTNSRFQIDVEAQWQESAKVRALFTHLEAERMTGEKSIVFSQWTAFLDLLEIPLKRRKFNFVRLDGSLSQQQREKAIKDFTERPEIGVMLISLKAGGVGINLTAASNAFLLDPWWNPAVEEQAIMRVHRIGQTKNVTIRRFIVKGSVEERMQQVQARKQKMVNGALTDQEMKTARLEDLKMLFR